MATKVTKARWRNWQKCKLAGMVGSINNTLLNQPDNHSMSQWEKHALIQLRQELNVVLSRWDNNTKDCLKS